MEGPGPPPPLPPALQTPESCQGTGWAAVLRAGWCAAAWTRTLDTLPCSTATLTEQQQDVGDEEWFIFWIESPQGLPWYVLLLEAMLVSVVGVLPEAKLRSIVGAAHLCCHWGPG